MRIAVLGAGSWGTAVANLLAKHSHDVVIWARRDEIASEINQSQTNHTYLAKIELSALLKATSDIKEIPPSDLIILATPSFAIRETLEALSSQSAHLLNSIPIVSLTKGIEYQENSSSLRTISDLITDVAGHVLVFALSGPSFAAEVAAGLPTSVVLAGKDQQRCADIQQQINSSRFRVYSSPDLLGVQLAGTFKNIIALAAGISQGYGMGDNARGALISRGLVEMSRLGVKLGAQKETFFGLAGLGDTIISSMSSQSRNFQVGARIGAGESLENILASMSSVAEGVYAVKAICAYAEESNVELPISRSVFRILYENADLESQLTDLMTRDPKSEGI